MEAKYISLEDEVSRTSSSDYSKEDALLGGQSRRLPHSRWWQHKSSINSMGLLVSIIFLLIASNVVTMLTVRSYFAGPTGTLTETSVFSPIHNMVKIPLVDKKIDNSPAANKSNPDHIFRLNPSPEVDAAWRRISNIPMFPISHDDIVRLQKDPDISVVAPEDWGFGNDEYGNPNFVFEPDVFHQLHCLNTIRKGLINNYDYYWGEMYGFVPPVNFERHLNHCVDIVRQALMCHADVEAVTYNWRKTQKLAFPDFGVHRKCKDWDFLLDWAEKNKMPDTVHRFDVYTKPDDAKELPAPPDLPKPGEHGVVKAPPGLGVEFIQSLSGLAGVEYCLGHKNETKL